MVIFSVAAALIFLVGIPYGAPADHADCRTSGIRISRAGRRGARVVPLNSRCQTANGMTAWATNCDIPTGSCVGIGSRFRSSLRPPCSARTRLQIMRQLTTFGSQAAACQFHGTRSAGGLFLGGSNAMSSGAPAELACQTAKTVIQTRTLPTIRTSRPERFLARRVSGLVTAYLPQGPAKPCPMRPE
jgi:hypothetical protein